MHISNGNQPTHPTHLFLLQNCFVQKGITTIDSDLFKNSLGFRSFVEDAKAIFCKRHISGEANGKMGPGWHILIITVAQFVAKQMAHLLKLLT